MLEMDKFQISPPSEILRNLHICHVWKFENTLHVEKLQDRAKQKRHFLGIFPKMGGCPIRKTCFWPFWVPKQVKYDAQKVERQPAPPN